MELKPALTYEQQLQKLIVDHHLTVLNEAEALQILKTVNYYRLSGYGIGLKQKKIRSGIRKESRLRKSMIFIVLTVSSKPR